MVNLSWNMQIPNFWRNKKSWNPILFYVNRTFIFEPEKNLTEGFVILHEIFVRYFVKHHFSFTLEAKKNFRNFILRVGFNYLCQKGVFEWKVSPSHFQQVFTDSKAPILYFCKKISWSPNLLKDFEFQIFESQLDLTLAIFLDLSRGYLYERVS